MKENFDQAAGERDFGGENGGSRGVGRAALCIGIDNYPNPRDRLSACVRDAQAWQRWFTSQGFSARTLLDSQATRAGITGAIQQLISRSSSGDVIAIHYSGHGTHFADRTSDEQDREDEALVPFDHRSSGFIVDDDIAGICNQIPAGVNVSFFMDCCHSGSNTRFLVGPLDDHGDEKVRFLAPDEEMLRVHARTRQSSGARATSRSGAQPEILFAACKAHQLSKESGGHGHFTRAALGILSGGTQGLTNSAFLTRVRGQMHSPNQIPELWCESRFYHTPILGAHAAGGGSPQAGSAPAGTGGGDNLSQLLAQINAQLAQLQNRGVTSHREALQDICCRLQTVVNDMGC